MKTLYVLLPLVVLCRAFAGSYGNSALDTIQEMPCCSWASGSCRNVCSKISLVALGAEEAARENATSRLAQFCSHELVDFWNCFNSTLREARKNENWPGRACCHLAQSHSCRSKCALGGSRLNLNEFCRASDELEFFGCLEKREDTERCCSSVSNSTCRSICRDLFQKPGKPSSLKVYTSMGCFHEVPKCLKSVAEVKRTEDPKQYLHCCDQAKSPECLETCRKILQTATTNQEILDSLEEKCGKIKPHLPPWSCIMKSAPTKPTRLPLNVGKLSCCSRATRRNCQDLCYRAFQADWESAWTQLESQCLSANAEGELRRCLEDADEACELGCNGLSYCAKFNRNPTALFRSCSTKSDEAAKVEADHWFRGGIIQGLGVPVRAAASCPIETLRAAACLLQLQPCESRIHETRLCREECLELMVSCVDWSVINGAYTASQLCSKLSPSRPDSPCVSLKPYLEDTEEDPREAEDSALVPEEDIATPCRSSPCPSGQLCVVDSEGPNVYKCLGGCSIGEMSKQVIPLHSWIQIPRFDQPSCYKICQCTARGLEKCRDLNCLHFITCWVQNRFVEHRSSFYLECNPCQCFEGEVTCSRKSCAELRIPSLPCDCPAHYVPVCGRLGYTFASACLAKCSGLSTSDIEFGRCSSKDPCSANPCGPSQRCVPRSRVCLSPIHKPCRQYECVPLSCDWKEAFDPVCDRNNREYVNICEMIKANGLLGYRGHCLKGCSLRGPVCGMNGEVYVNECAAWADKVVVDYDGHCMATGLIGDQPKSRCGDAVDCPALAAPFCIGVTPPGACCPVCGGGARLFYSRKQLERIYYTMDEERDKDSVTLGAMLTALQRQIQVAECSLKGMLTPEGDIFIIVQAVLRSSRKPSALQMRACIAETEKLVTRIQERSPQIVAEVPLSSLTRAEILHTYISNGTIENARISFMLVPVILLLNVFAFC